MGPAAQAAGLVAAPRARGAAAPGRLRPRPDHAAHLEVRVGALPGRHPGADRLCGRSAVRPPQRRALGRTRTAAHDRPLRRPGAAQGRGAAVRTIRCRSSIVPDAEIAAWRQRLGLAAGRAALPPSRRARSDRRNAGRPAISPRRPGSLRPQGFSVWSCWAAPARRRSPPRSEPARTMSATSPARICATPSWRLAAADVAVSNNSGLLHVAAALGTPSIGIFGPTSPWHWAPLNPLAAVIETQTAVELPALPQADLPLRPSSLHARDSGRSAWWRPRSRRANPPDLPCLTSLARSRADGYQAGGASRASGSNQCRTTISPPRISAVRSTCSPARPATPSFAPPCSPSRRRSKAACAPAAR